MYLGIEIGGTKLQLGVGDGQSPDLVALERRDVDSARGAAGIREQIRTVGRALVQRHHVSRVGYGFGGPINAATGYVTTSHQISGWDNFPLVQWTEQELGVPVVLSNDCDAAALAEARYGAGKGRRIVFFVTVGTGVGGGLVIDGTLHATHRPAVAEIGHLRTTLDPDQQHAIVEDMASGRGIEHEARRRLAAAEAVTDTATAADRDGLLALCKNDPETLTARMVADAARTGIGIARDVWQRCFTALGWGIAQVLALASPEVVVVGGGVSLAGEELFFQPLREEVAKQVFRPLAGSYEILPAALGELVVVHGAIARAAAANQTSRN